MKTAARLLRALRLALAVTLCATAALAQPTVDSTVSTNRAEVGERFQVQLEAMSSDEPAPSDPRLDTPPGFVVQGPSVSSRHQVSIINGDFSHQRGLTATWTVAATKPGKYILGPARVHIGGRSVTGQTFEIEIVPKGTLKRPSPGRQRGSRRRRPFTDPFDMDPFDLDPFDLMPKLPTMPRQDADDVFRTPSEHPPELEVERAPDDIAFLRAVAKPSHAVVGQQVTLKIFAYGSRGPFKEVYTSEPSRADFVSEPIIENSYNEPRYRLYIDDELWHAVEVREIALFPLKAGTLEIGRMRMGFAGARYPRDAAHKGLVRYSEPLEVIVREPPLAGRPPGYEIGDVGRFSLSAEVHPREVSAGDAVSVRVKLAGTGNPPGRLRLPETAGVEFNDPTIDESIEAKGSTIVGSRTFSYVVHLQEAGNVDLGDVTLPYYDPRRGRYDIARASLGTVVVRPSAAMADEKVPAVAPNQALQRVGEHAAVRTELTPLPTASFRWTDHRAYWLLLFAGPAFVLTATGVARGGRRLSARWADRRRSHSAVAREALREAREAASRGDGRAAATSIERAVYATIEEQTGLKARGVLRADLAETLKAEGLEATAAQAVVALLDSLDDLRFTAANASADAVVSRAQGIVSRLSRIKRRSRAR